jgi:ribosomal protein L4
MNGGVSSASPTAPKKVRRAALASALSLRAQEKKLVVLDAGDGTDGAAVQIAGRQRRQRLGTGRDVL